MPPAGIRNDHYLFNKNQEKLHQVKEPRNAIAQVIYLQQCSTTWSRKYENGRIVQKAMFGWGNHCWTYVQE